MHFLADMRDASGLGEPLAFRKGITRSVSVIGKPLLDSENSHNFWKVMSHSLKAEQIVREALLFSANLELESWLAAIRPMQLHKILHCLL